MGSEDFEVFQVNIPPEAPSRGAGFANRLRRGEGAAPSTRHCFLPSVVANNGFIKIRALKSID